MDSPSPSGERPRPGSRSDLPGVPASLPWVGKLVHEINNALGIAAGKARLRQGDAVLPELVSRDLQTVRDQTERASALLDSLLRSLAPNLAERRQGIQVPLDHALQLISPRAHRQGVTVQTELDADLAPVATPAGQLEQVFLNLLWNALDVMPDGGTLGVRARRTPTGVQVSVSDTGPGLDASLHERLQASRPLSGAELPSTGLGLIVCQQVLGASGGSLEAESGPAGATFHLRLPAA